VRLGLRGKLVVGVGIYLSLLALVGIMGLYAAQISLTGLHSAHEHNVREINLLADLGSAVEGIQRTVLLHSLTDSTVEQTAYEAQIAELENEIDALFDQEVSLQRAFGDQEDVTRFENLRQAWHQYLRELDEQFIPLSREDRNAEALALVQEDGPIDLAYEQAVAQLASVQGDVESESRDRLDLAEEQFAFNRNLLLVALLAAGAFGIIFGLWQSSRLAAAVGAVSSAARTVARGDFGHHLYVRTGDEIESLADSFNVMTANLQRMQDEQHAVDRMKDEFVSMVSHELRTPLNVVIGMTDLLLQTDLQPRARGYAEGVQRSGQVLLAIVDDILDLSKIEAGKLDLERVPVDLRRLAADIADLFAERAQGKGVELTWRVGDAVPSTVQGDPIRLRQVLLNLVGNALKFTEAGSVRLHIDVVHNTGDTAVVRFDVVDTGVGIAPHAREHLFKPFSQADSSTTRKFGGAGLGLNICQRLVQLMGGTIDFDSQVGRGSTFWFTAPLPIAASAATPDVDGASLERAQTRGAGIQRAGRGRRVLVVEDSWMNQQVAVSMLEQVGYTAEVAADGREALEALERKSYAMVLLDCQMPELDGYQVAAEVRRRESREGRQPVPIVALTASAMAADRERCLAAGMNDYLAKPVRIAELAAMVERWVPQVLNAAALDGLARLQRPGRPDLLAALLDRYLTDAPRRLDALREAVERADAQAITRWAHTLKSESRQIGGSHVAQLCAEIEALGRSDMLDDAAVRVSALARALDRLYEALRARVDERALCAS
jgi:signal transduction histidine kinase/DNA-binding response OmpR family regulator